MTHLEASRLRQHLAHALRIVRHGQQHRLPPRIVVIGDVVLIPTNYLSFDADRPAAMIDYSHGEYRHCAPVTSMPLLTISAREEGTGSAASAGRGEGTGTAASAGRGECTSIASLSFQQCWCE